MVRTEEAVFDMYIGDSGEKRAYVERSVHCASMKKVIAEILEADGVPVLAHVFNYGFPPHERNYLIKTFVQEGGLAIEAFIVLTWRRYSNIFIFFVQGKEGWESAPDLIFMVFLNIIHWNADILQQSPVCWGRWPGRKKESYGMMIVRESKYATGVY